MATTQCGHCQTSNPATHNYCGNCGANLSGACPRCGTTVPPGNKYCGKCGTNIAGPGGGPQGNIAGPGGGPL